MPKIVFQKGIISLGLIVFALVGLTAAVSYGVIAEEWQSGRSFSDRFCALYPNSTRCQSAGSSTTGVSEASPQPSPTSSSTDISPSTSTSTVSPLSTTTSTATCEITKPDLTQTSALSGIGISQVARLKVLGIFTVRVTGVPRSDPSVASSRYYLSAVSGASHWIARPAARSADGYFRRSGNVFLADAGGTFTSETAVSKYSYSSQIGPAPVGTHKDKLAESRYTIPLYRLYLLNTADNVVARCGIVLVDTTAPGETLLDGPISPTGSWGN